MTISIVFLLLLVLLLLVLGIVAVTTISTVAKKARKRPDNKPTDDCNGVDPWIEAGKRSNSDDINPQ